MVQAVEDVLHEIGADAASRILVLGKVDLVDADRRHELRHRHPDATLVSAVTGEGLPELIERIEEEFRRRLQWVELLIPYSDGGRLAELHGIAGELERTEEVDGVRVRALVPPSVAARFSAFAVAGRAG